MPQESNLLNASAADATAIKQRIDEVRRSLFGDQSRLKRRRDEVKRLSDLEARLADGALSPTDRRAIEDICGTLRRGLERARLLDGSDEALAQRTAQAEEDINRLELQQGELKAQAANSARASSTGDADRERERAQRTRRQKLVTTVGALERQVDAAEASGNVPAAAAVQVDDADLSDDALRARLQRLSGRIDRLVRELWTSRRRASIRVAALEQELTYWDRSRSAEKTIDLDALSRHLHNEMQRFMQLLDAHLAAGFAQSVQYMDGSLISRFNLTESEPEADPAFEQISFRGQDIRLLSDLAQILVEPLLQAQGRLLPTRSAMAFASFRGRNATLCVLDTPLVELAGQAEFQVPAIPAPLIAQTVQSAVQLKGVAPLAPRAEVPPIRRLKRGDVLGAIGALLVRAARFPTKFLQPLAILSLLGFSVLRQLKSGLSQLEVSGIAAFLVILLILTYRSWTKEARLSQIELLKKGKAGLRDLVAKQLEDLRQTWKRLVTEHCDRFVDQAIADLKRRVESSAIDELRIQREYKRVESELRERINDQRKVLDAHVQARRMANENIKSLSAAVEAELASMTAAKAA